MQQIGQAINHAGKLTVARDKVNHLIFKQNFRKGGLKFTFDVHKHMDLEPDELKNL